MITGTQRLQDYQVVTDLGALNDLKQTAQKDPSEALRPVAQQFEALFIQQILKEARKIQLDEGYMEGGQSDFYKSWHDDQMAQTLSAKGSFGMADTIVKQLTPKHKTLTPDELVAYEKTLREKQAAILSGSATTQDNLALRRLK